MSQSNSETGIVKNVTNLKSVISYLTSLGSAYQPTRPLALMVNLNALLSACESLVGGVGTALIGYGRAVDKQEEAFLPLDKLVRRLVGAFQGSIEDPEAAATAIAYRDKITGDGSSAKKHPSPPADGDGGGRSTAQLSYDNRLAHFELLIKLLEQTPEYSPNEEELQVGTLWDLHADMKAKTEAVDKALEPVLNGRIARDNVMFDPKTGILVSMTAIKKYLKGAFGPSSAQLAYVTSFKFVPNKK